MTQSKKYKKLDDLFSEYIRKRAMAKVGGCERCLTVKNDITKEDGKILPAWKQLQCSHFWGRKRLSVRFDEANCSGLCGSCHLYFTSNPEEHRAWMLKRLGQREYDMLEARASRISRKGGFDENAMYLWLKSELAKLEGR